VAWRRDMISLIYGGITHHYMAPKLNYCNTINSVGTIHNEYVIAMAGNRDFKLGLLKGKDSACGNIVGPISSFRIDDNVDFMLGGYNTNFNTFEKRGIVPPSVGGITPVVGLNFKIPITDTIKINNLVSIGIISHALSVEF
jgi:hypothetical protein